MTACAIALKATGRGSRCRLDGHDRAILGTYGDGPVTPGLILSGPTAGRFDFVVHDETAEEGTSL